MTKTRLFSLAAIFAALLFLLTLPASAQCDPTTDPSCRLSPLQSRQVNPAAQSLEGASAELEASGALESVQLSDLPLVAAGSLSLNGSPGASSELRAQSPELGAQSSATDADSSATEAPSFSSLDLRMRYQDPSDVSCGVQALGMALAGVSGDGLEAPASSALLGFLQGQGMMYDFGTGVEELAYAAGSFGFKGTQPFRGWTLADLRAELVEGRPVVVALGSNGKGVPGHFVTVTGISEDGQWISYNDPTLGKVTKPIDEFNALWGAQGNSGVSVRSPSSVPAGTPDNLPLLALMAGIMALVSATPLGKLRQGVGGRIAMGSGGANSNAPPHPAPAGQRWQAKTVPVYETRTVQEGWTTVSRQVPIKEMVKEQVGTRTYFEKIPKFKTITVQDGHKWVKHSVPKYKTVSYVRGYRYRTTRVPSWRGWRYVRRRVPIYGSRRVRAGSKTVWRKVPKYVTKDVPDGYHTIQRTKPVYTLQEKIVGYETVEKRIPRMVDKREQVGTKTEWKLERIPTSQTSSSKPRQLQIQPEEDAPNWWEALLNQISQASTWLQALTEKEAVDWMRNAPADMPNIALPLPMLKGFGKDEYFGYLYKTAFDGTAGTRALGRTIGDIGVLPFAVLGYGMTVYPNINENARSHAEWNEFIGEWLVDSGGYVASEVAGAAVGGGTFALTENPLFAYVAKIGGDILAGATWEVLAAENNWNEFMTAWVKAEADATMASIQAWVQANAHDAEYLDNRENLRVPTPDPDPTGTPEPASSVGN